MFTKLTIAALATVLVGLGATSEAASARARTVQQGREVAAPPWAFTCINDQGPTQCGEPIWVYGKVR